MRVPAIEGVPVLWSNAGHPGVVAEGAPKLVLAESRSTVHPWGSATSSPGEQASSVKATDPGSTRNCRRVAVVPMLRMHTVFALLKEAVVIPTRVTTGVLRFSCQAAQPSAPSCRSTLATTGNTPVWTSSFSFTPVFAVSVVGARTPVADTAETTPPRVMMLTSNARRSDVFIALDHIDLKAPFEDIGLRLVGDTRGFQPDGVDAIDCHREITDRSETIRPWVDAASDER